MSILKKLKLTNVGIHEQVEIDFGKVFTTVKGANTKGKTTIEKAILDCIESIRENLLSVDKEDGQIILELDDGMKILQPLSNSGKPTARLYQGEMEVKAARTKLKELNTTNIRAIDFFKGEGAKLEREQVETLLSIIKLKLEKKEIENICGELPLSDRFEDLHPLDYINSLTNDKDGFYYTARAENNKSIHTVKHSNDGLYAEIVKVLNELNENIDTIDIDSYVEMNISDEVEKLMQAKDKNQKIIDTKNWIEEFQVKVEKMKKDRDDFLEMKKIALTTEFSDTIDADKKKIYEALKSDFEEIGKEIFEKHDFDTIEGLHESLTGLPTDILDNARTYSKTLNETIAKRDKTIEDKIDIYRKNLEEKIVEYESHKEPKEKFVKENPEPIDVTLLQNKIDRISKIKEILPTYKVWNKNKVKYESMEERSKELTEIIDTLRKLPKQLLQRSKMPVENLSINDDGKFVYQNNKGKMVPLLALSGFEQTALSLDVSIAKLGKIRTLLIPQWGEIDTENKRLIIRHLHKNKVQGVAIEVGEGDLKINSIDNLE